MASSNDEDKWDSPPGEYNAEATALANLARTQPSVDTDASTVNDVRLAGRITGDPEFQVVDNRSIVRFHLAVEKRYRDIYDRDQKQTAYVPVAFGGALVERSREFLKIGSPIYIEGRLRSHFWKTPNGWQQTGLRLDAYKVQSLARGPSRSQGQEIDD